MGVVGRSTLAKTRADPIHPSTPKRCRRTRGGLPAGALGVVEARVDPVSLEARVFEGLGGGLRVCRVPYVSDGGWDMRVGARVDLIDRMAD